jgi:metallo-beta-lactamase family protein
MNIAFHGAARTVTGSKHLVTLDNQTQILLDCGMFQGRGASTDEWNKHFGFNPAEVSYVILSHAHIDHSGLLPKLVAEGFKGPIFCTAATLDLVRILLLDSAKIQEQDAFYENKRRAKEHKELIKPLYIEEDVEKTLSRFKVVPYDSPTAIDENIIVYFTDAGHILGSAAVHLSITENNKTTRLTFSGDVGRYGDLLLRAPQTFPQADYILIESTYGDRLHEEVIPPEETLRQIIEETCIKHGGKVVIPAFSVGRTQELLYALNALEVDGKLPDVPYYVDSPLSSKATAVIKSHPEVYNRGVKELMKIDRDPFDFKGLVFIEDVQDSIALNDDKTPCVIISASGMADAGRVKHHIRNTIDNPNNCILIAGYCEPRSLGGRLVSGQPFVRIFGEEHVVKAQVREIKSMSAHGDRDDLLAFLSCQNPALVKKLFIVHGEYESQINFKATLEAEGFQSVVIPDMHQSVELV